ncbi:2Fe-2S iron-sulfur cluster-binding protein [Paenibacillus sp. YN15]|uniref:2Fe-2S iron-sulfur cluster-binding protein n=1 Tax=Paenibacillus sp. YN15 TaxID=1742774 RepID=UPI000DCBAFFE|nr:2Fe-2S iron-sulfur cluster-binding protein [Paenibacillus sp. YN15]RAU94733.1 ferredoxin [Paenibacillus sp. YN15]
MPEVEFLPDGKKVVVRAGVTLLEAARQAKAAVRTRCSGGLSCLMCKVKVVGGSGGLSEPKQAETAKLGALKEQGYRFACQARVAGQVTVELPEDPLKAAVRAQLKRQQEEEELW